MAAEGDKTPLTNLGGCSSCSASTVPLSSPEFHAVVTCLLRFGLSSALHVLELPT